MKNLQINTGDKNSVFARLLTLKGSSGTNLRTSRPQISENGCQYRDEDSKNKT